MLLTDTAVAYISWDIEKRIIILFNQHSILVIALHLVRFQMQILQGYAPHMALIRLHLCVL